MSTAISSESDRVSALLASFAIGDSFYALDASAVQEVIRVPAMSRVPHAPPAVLGVINLRGRIVTILDTAIVLGHKKSVLGRDSRIFVVEDRGEFLGLLVDRVAEVFEYDPAAASAVPANVPREQACFYRGIHVAGGRAIALLNAAQMLSAAALQSQPRAAA
jgi:purine-binding chemotaxis protein CheW